MVHQASENKVKINAIEVLRRGKPVTVVVPPVAGQLPGVHNDRLRQARERAGREMRVEGRDLGIGTHRRVHPHQFQVGREHGWVTGQIYHDAIIVVQLCIVVFGRPRSKNQYIVHAKDGESQ